MKIEYLEEFVLLADELNFSRAARKLNSSASVLSKHVSALEKEVGQKLLNRSTTNVSLTPAGRMLYEGVIPLVDQYHALIGSLRALKPSSPNNLNIAIGIRASYLMAALAPTIAALDEHNISVSCETPMSDTYYISSDMTGINALITYVTSKLPENTVTAPLALDPFVAIVKKTHPLAGKQRVSIVDDLSQHRIIRLKSAFFRAGQDAIMDAFDSYGVSPSATYSLASSLDDLVMLSESDEVLILPRNALSVLKVHEDTHSIIPFKEDLSFQLAVVFPPENNTQALRLFIDELKQQMAAIG